MAIFELRLRQNELIHLGSLYLAQTRFRTILSSFRMSEPCYSRYLAALSLCNIFGCCMHDYEELHIVQHMKVSYKKKFSRRTKAKAEISLGRYSAVYNSHWWLFCCIYKRIGYATHPLWLGLLNRGGSTKSRTLKKSVFLKSMTFRVTVEGWHFFFAPHRPTLLYSSEILSGTGISFLKNRVAPKKIKLVEQQQPFLKKKKKPSIVIFSPNLGTAASLPLASYSLETFCRFSCGLERRKKIMGKHRWLSVFGPLPKVPTCVGSRTWYFQTRSCCMVVHKQSAGPVVKY